MDLPVVILAPIFTREIIQEQLFTTQVVVGYLHLVESNELQGCGLLLEYDEAIECPCPCDVVVCLDVVVPIEHHIEPVPILLICHIQYAICIGVWSRGICAIYKHIQLWNIPQLLLVRWIVSLAFAMNRQCVVYP